jgi:hypothetical protein
VGLGVGPSVGPFISRFKRREIASTREKERGKGIQGKVIVSPRSCERVEYLTRGRVKVFGRSMLGPSFLDEKLHKKDYSPSFGLVRVAQAIEEAGQ